MCEAMRKAIISRAFYGWFAHCRHLATVRKHLSSLVKARPEDGSEEFRKIEEEFWKDELYVEDKVSLCGFNMSNHLTTHFCCEQKVRRFAKGDFICTLKCVQLFCWNLNFFTDIEKL